MFYGDKKTKINLNQYYTPITIGDFITSLCIINKEIIDPACGTGDLIINYDGNLTLWDISNDIIDICKLNCDLHKKTYIINNINSIKEFDKNNKLYDYCALNPPFGNSTLCNDKNILNNYELGRNKNKEEIGILFIERSINLLHLCTFKMPIFYILYSLYFLTLFFLIFSLYFLTLFFLI
jgi:type I restriction-modification system DNA methylase subunit